MVAARLRAVAAALVLVALAPAPVLGGVPPQDSVEREWRVRADALDPRAALDGWRAGAASTDWTERHAVLEAALRAARLGALAEGGAGGPRDLARELARRALADRHANLAALGARLLVALWAEADADGAALEGLAASPLAEARQAAAPLVAVRRVDLLADLAADGDPDVRDAAVRAALDRLVRAVEEAEADDPPVTSVLARLVLERAAAGLAAGDEAEAVAWLAPLGTARPEAALAVAAAPLEPGPAADRARLLARVAAAAAGAQLDPATFVDAWCASESWSPARDALFARAAERLGPPVVSELVVAADLACAVQHGTEPGADARAAGPRRAALEALFAGPAGDERYPFSSVLLRAAHRAGGTAVLIGSLARAGDDLFERALEVLAPQLVGWTPELAEGAFERAERGGFVDAVLGALVVAAREGDAAATGFLAARLAVEPDAARRRYLFRMLARLPDPAPVTGRLVLVWKELDDDEAVELASLLPHTSLEPGARRRLLALAQRRPAARGTLARALRGQVGDEEVCWYLERWVVELLGELDGQGSAQRRATLERAAELFPVLAEVGGDQAVEGLVGALEWSVGRQPDVGVLAVRALGLAPEGRAALRGYLAVPLDRETRTELALALAGEDVPPAELERDADALVDLLVADGGGGSIADGTRRLEALARLDTPRAVDALCAFAADPAVPDGFAIGALEALGRTSVDPARVDALARRTRGYDRRRAALRALERLGAAEELARFEADWRELADAVEPLGAVWADGSWPRRVLGLDLALPAHPEEMAGLEAELWTALVRLGAAPSAWTAAVLERPLADAARTLRARFQGAPVADPRFEHWEVLELAEVAARRSELRAVLDAAPGWERLDGRLLLELAERAARAGERSAEALASAAVVALEGEGPSADGPLLRARALAADLAWRERRWGQAAVLYGLLADPFQARPHGRRDDAARPLPGGDEDGLLELERRAAWAAALAAAERGEGAASLVHLRRAATLAAVPPAARERQREVERLVRVGGGAR